LIDCHIATPILLAADAGASNPLGPVMLIVPLIAIWYFLLIRPQSQQRKKMQGLLESLKTGDQVITSGGIYGTIVGFKDGVVQLQIASQVKVDVARSAITGLAADPADEAGKPDSGAKGKK
jgi:preprotein translocase subunit YajC